MVAALPPEDKVLLASELYRSADEVTELSQELGADVLFRTDRLAEITDQLCNPKRL